MADDALITVELFLVVVTGEAFLHRWCVRSKIVGRLADGAVAMVAVEAQIAYVLFVAVMMCLERDRVFGKDPGFHQ